MMNARTRMLEALLFGAPDRIPLVPGWGRESTLAAWHAQGLPKHIGALDAPEQAYREVGGKLPWPKPGPALSVNERMIPIFDEKVIEERATSRVVQDWKGNICEIGNEFGLEHMRNPIDFVTRRWIKCPVETRADWEAMKARYNADDPSRIPAVADRVAAQGSAREDFIEISFSGPFWQLREWTGFEQLCTLFYDDPAWVMEMIEFWRDYIAHLLHHVLARIKPDSVHLAEDMAYKSFAMISPAMCREFLLPTWRHWGEIVRGAGVPLYSMDSDGFIGELIPLWIEAGMNACDPLEVAAGNDIVAFRRQFGREMAYRGGIDKRAMAKGGQVIKDEIDRLRPVIESGGFIPSCDHGVPADVSWPDFVEHTRLLAKATGWM